MKHEVIDESNAAMFMGGFLGKGGFYIRPMPITMGRPHKGHSHYINHVGLLRKGAVRIEWHHEKNLDDAGVTEVLVPGVKIDIRADYWHTITALVEGTEWDCWFAAAEADRVYGEGNNVPYYLEKDGQNV